MNNEIVLITPTGHLGLTPFEKESFLIGCEHNPDFIVADSGSSDIGPRALGQDINISPADWQYDDIELMLCEARRLGVPLIIGSASDAGTDRGVNAFLDIIRDIAAKHDLAPFNVKAIYSEQDLRQLSDAIKKNGGLNGLDSRGPASIDDIDKTDRAVAVMGVHPIQQALADGADVIVAGRSADICLFAAPLLNAGIDPGLAYLAGKILECASYCAEPFMSKETMLGRVTQDALYITPMQSKQRCSQQSILSQVLYERSNPFEEHVPGGVLDLSNIKIEEVEGRTVKLTGARFKPSPSRQVKIEGAGKVGERRLAIIGMRDSRTVDSVDAAIAYARSRVDERYGDDGDWRLYFHVYGRNGVLAERERHLDYVPKEACIVVEAVHPNADRAFDICMLAMRQILMARLPNVPGGSPIAAPMADEVLAGPAGYTWTLNHLMPIDDWGDVFRTEDATIHSSQAAK